MFRMGAAIVAAGLLASCASMQMQEMVGQPLERVMVKHGTPVNAFDMPDGRRAFQWQVNTSFVMPGTVNTVSNANIYAPRGAFATVSGTSSTTYMPPQQINGSCLYTMYAEERGGHWYIVAFEKPNLMCE